MEEQTDIEKAMQEIFKCLNDRFPKELGNKGFGARISALGFVISRHFRECIEDKKHRVELFDDFIHNLRQYIGDK